MKKNIYGVEYEDHCSFEITLKGRAFCAALDAGLVRPNIFGRTPLDKFMQFWELFSPWLPVYADEYIKKEDGTDDT